MESFPVLFCQQRIRRHISYNIEGSRICHNKDCAICIENCSNGIMLKCGHTFHTHCILKWMKHERSCPLCRKSIEHKHVHELENYLRDFKFVLALPIESLLNFKCAVHIGSLTDLNVDYMIENSKTFFSKISQCAYIKSNEANDLYDRCMTIQKIRENIKIFDNNASNVLHVSPQDTKSKYIQQRLALPFEQIFNRVKNTSHELSVLESEPDSDSQKILRGRLCELWMIEKTIVGLMSNVHRHFHNRSLPRTISVIGPFEPDNSHDQL